MKIKSKKGAVILTMSALAFLLTVFLIANYQVKTSEQGKRQAELLDIAEQGENALFYIDQMVRLSLAETWVSKSGREGKYVISEGCVDIDFSCKSDFEGVFEFKFIKNLNIFNKVYKQDLKYLKKDEKGESSNFEIVIKSYGARELEGLEIIGKSNKKIVIENKNMKYSILPNFHIKLSIEELNLLK